jgi:hypothetical protein
MTVDQFDQLKQAIEHTLNRKLELSRSLSKPYSCAAETEQQTFEVYDDDNQLNMLKQVIDFAKQHNGVVSHNIVEKSPGRIGYYSHTEYRVTYTKLYDNVSKAHLKRIVHTALRGIMKLDRWSYIKCDIMQLFKDGKIDWDTVVLAHKTDCSL